MIVRAIKKLKELATGAVALMVGLWLFGCLLAGFGSLLVQSVHWLRYGYWDGLNSLTIVAFFGGADAEQWIANPQDWFGLHQLLEWLPQSAGLCIIGVIPMAAAFVVGEGLMDQGRKTCSG